MKAGYILRCAGLLRPYYLQKLRPCGLPVDTYDRTKAKIYKDRAGALYVCRVLNDYIKSLAAAGGTVNDRRDLYEVECI